MKICGLFGRFCLKSFNIKGLKKKISFFFLWFNKSIWISKEKGKKNVLIRLIYVFDVICLVMCFLYGFLCIII